MYAIVKTGGKQYRVEQGQTLLVERLPQAEGETVMLEPLLVRSEEAVFDAEGLAKVEVSATIVNHLRGKKLRVFKFKPKRGYRRRTGHRQELTRIEVTHIGAPAARGAARRAAAEPKAAEGAGAEPEATTPRAAAAKPATVPASAAARATDAGEQTPAPRTPATRSKQAAPAEPDAAPSKEPTDGA
ncbi:MAG: 50S ribosomal protein L21 [Solirubrobacteraceae bacterium]